MHKGTKALGIRHKGTKRKRETMAPLLCEQCGASEVSKND